MQSVHQSSSSDKTEALKIRQGINNLATQNPKLDPELDMESSHAANDRKFRDQVDRHQKQPMNQEKLVTVLGDKESENPIDHKNNDRSLFQAILGHIHDCFS